MDFVDNVIAPSTGTIRGRALFANPNGVFTPGMFARVRVPASPPYEALLVPDVAIGSEQARKFVLVVDGDNTAQHKYVTLGQLRRQAARDQGGPRADDRVDRQRHGARARRPEGQSAKRRARQAGAPRPASRRPRAGKPK